MNPLPDHGAPLECWVRLAQAWDGLLFAVLGLALCAALTSPDAQAAARAGDADGAPAAQSVQGQPVLPKPHRATRSRAQPVITEQRDTHDPLPEAAVAPRAAVAGRTYSSASANPSSADPACAAGRCGWVESVSTLEPGALPPGMVVGVGLPSPRYGGKPANAGVPAVVAQAPAPAGASGGQVTRFQVKVRTDDGHLLSFEQPDPVALGTRVRVAQGQLHALRVAPLQAAQAVHAAPSVAGKTYHTD